MPVPFRRLLPALIVLAAGGAAAEAQTQGLDANADGKISRAEFIAGRTARFNQIDKNKDGVINTADFPRAMSRPRAAEQLGQLIASADLNKDGAVTRAELSKAGTPAFDRADTNRDGVVDQTEAASLRTALAARR